MDVKKIEELIRVLEASPTEELCVQKGDYKVCIRKGAKPAGAASGRKMNPEASRASGAAGRRVSPEPSGASGPASGRKTSPQASGPEASAPAEHFIKANMVGIFHVVDGIAKVGATIAEGEVVGAIESMKLMNELKSSVSGVVKKVLVEDGTPVQYGDHLFQVEPR